MSQTVDSPLKTLIPGAFNGGGGKDKLLKLAESSKGGGGKEETSSSIGKKSKKKGVKYNKSADSSYDLAFTSNIEHLAIRDHHNISQRSSTPIDSSFSDNSGTASPIRNNNKHDVNLSCDSPNTSLTSPVSSTKPLPCECIAHTTSLLDTISSCSGPSLHQQFGEVLSLSETTQSFISPSSEVEAADLLAIKSRIPQSVDRRRLKEFNRALPRGLNRWPDTDDLSTQQAVQQQQLLSHLQTSTDQTAARGPISPDNDNFTTTSTTTNTSTSNSTNTSTTTISRLTSTSTNHVQSHIPVYNKQRQQKQRQNSAPNVHQHWLPSSSPGNSSQLPSGVVGSAGRASTNHQHNIITNTGRSSGFFRANSFISYLADYNDKYNQLQHYAQSIGTSTTTNRATTNNKMMTGFGGGSSSPDRNVKWYEHQYQTSISNSDSRLPQSATTSSKSSSSSQLTQARLQQLMQQQQYQNQQFHQQQQQTSAYQKMVKSRSHNFLQKKSSGFSKEFGSLSEDGAVYFPPPAGSFAKNFADSFFDQSRTRRAELFADDFSFSSPHIRHQQQSQATKPRLDSFFVIDEDQPSFINSPKRIEITSSKQRNLPPSLLTHIISTPEQAQYDKLFLRESQKSALTSITSEASAENGCKAPKSNSFDNLGNFTSSRQSLTKPKSETDLSNEASKNDLARILHLEEESTDDVEDEGEEDSVLNRFKKSFSLRNFSKHWAGGSSKTATAEQSRSPQEASTQPLTSTDLASKEFLTINEEEIVSGSSSISRHHQQFISTTSSDINQNRISFTKNLQQQATNFAEQLSAAENNNNFSFSSGGSGNSSFASTSSNNIGKMSTIERRKSRADMFNRKSFRRSTTTRKSGTSAAATLRLKRSHSQPHDNNSNSSKSTSDFQNPNQLSPQTDRSVDSDFDGGTKSPSSCHSSQADTAKSGCGSELNDSQENNDEVIYAEAIWDYLTSDNEELNFRCGDLINVTDTSHKEWWWGAIKGKGELETRYGWFPASYVRLKVSQGETLEEEAALETGDETQETDENEPNNNSPVNTTLTASITSTISASLNHQSDLIKSTSSQNETNLSTSVTTPVKKRMSMSSKLSGEQVRANVVQEIVNTERDFVKNLRDVIDGYLKPCRDRKDMFDTARLATIFGNIEELYAFQVAFLAQLEASLNPDSLAASEIGSVFLRNEAGFAVYGEFATNHPLAISELQDLYTDTRYIVFFEGCRLLQNMIDISLDGFLLTPIQKICKYPLQLGELLKYTKPDHPDHVPVSAAYQCMQRVAAAVNERKRRFEALEQLIGLQEAFAEGSWEGPSLLDSGCSLLIHSGELTRLTGSAGWSTRSELTLLLFDRLLVLAKRDTGGLLLKNKGTVYQLKSRLPMDEVEEVVSSDAPAPTEEDTATSTPAKDVLPKNSFKFFYRRKAKWYLFQAKSSAERDRWLAAFAEQRTRVAEDEAAGFEVTERDKRCAQLAHANHLKPKRPTAARSRRPYHGYAASKAKKPDTVIAEIPLVSLGDRFDRNRAGSLPSYIFQGTGGIGGTQQQSILNGLYGKNGRQSTMHAKKSSSNWFQLGSSKGSGGAGNGGSKNKSKMLKRNLK